MSKFMRLIATILISTIFLTACGGDKDAGSGEANNTTGAAKSDLKVGVVLTNSGRGDKSFNDSAIKGLDKATQDFGINYKEVQPKDMAGIETSLDFLAKDGYELIFTIGFTSVGAVEKVAPNYPDTTFAIIDYDFGEKIAPNVKSIVFKEEQGSFLAGVLAAEMSKNNVVAFTGGMESPLIKKFEAGFEAGVKYANPNVEVLRNYVAADSTGFNNPSKAKELTLHMISKNADVVYHAAGGSGTGVLEAAEEKGILAIGVDSNQNMSKPGTVVASMIKCVDVGVYNVISDLVDGKLEGGNTTVYDLKVDGVKLTDLTELEPEEEGDGSDKIKALKDTIPQVAKDKIDEAKAKIISGEIEVPEVPSK